MADTTVEKKLMRQIEYYFGDFNLPKDKFLLEEIKKDDGWVSLETMTNFKRLAAISSDLKVIGEAVKKSGSAFLEINEDLTKIRRDPKNAVPASIKEVFEKFENRTVFVKGFNTSSSLDDIEKFFETAGNVVNIVMRRGVDRKSFKGSVFATFMDKDECDKFLTSDEFKSVDDVPLIRMLRTDYVGKKLEEKQQLKASRAEAQVDAEKKRIEMRKARLLSRMTLGALMELSGVPKDVKESEVITILKTMMRTAEAPDVAFVETNELSEGRVVIRFKDENSAATAMTTLQAKEGALKFRVETASAKGDETSASDDKEKNGGKSTDPEKSDDKADDQDDKKTESNSPDAAKPKSSDEHESTLVCRVLSGEEEQKLWEYILEQRDKRQMNRKGKHGFHGRHRDGGEPQRKRQRVSNR